MRRILKLASAVGDSGLAAVASFAIGLVAVVCFRPDYLALFSLVFAGSVLGGVLPRQISLIPIRTHSNLTAPEAPRSLWRDIGHAKWSMALGAIVVAASGLPMLNAVGLPAVLFLGVTAALAMVAGAVQEHARAILHIMGRSHAALLSSLTGTSVTIVLSVLAALLLYGTGAVLLVPFGSLLAGYVASTLTYLAFTRRLVPSESTTSASLTERSSYVVTALMLQGVGYATNFTVLAFAGTSALASFESARVFAAPVLVIGTGLGNALKPRIIAAFGRRDHDSVRRGQMQLQASTVLIGIVYSGAVVLLGSVVGAITGRAVDPTLTGVRSLSFVPESMAGNLGAIHLAARRTRQWTWSNIATVSIELALLIPATYLLGVYGPPAVHAVTCLARVLIGNAVISRASHF